MIVLKLWEQGHGNKLQLSRLIEWPNLGKSRCVGYSAWHILLAKFQVVDLNIGVRTAAVGLFLVLVP